MPERSPEEVTDRSIRVASWVALVFAVIFVIVGSDLEALGPAADRPGRTLLTIGFVGSALATGWWIARHATAPARIRLALAAIRALMNGTLLLGMWAGPSVAVRVVFYVAAALLAAAAIQLWRYRRRMGLSFPSNERASIPDQVLYEDQALRQKPGEVIGHVITTLVFDVNETMLDLGALDVHFDRIFDEGGSRNEWFALVLRNALTLTIIGAYHDFGAVAGASLDMVAATRDVTLTEADRNTVATAMRNLPPHADVPGSLDLLQQQGLQLVALTNSPPDIATAQLTNAGLAGFFARIMSVHPTQRFKPHLATYQHAADEIGEPLRHMMMVAAHDWDIAGAMAAGMQGAFVTRPGMTLNPLLPPPTVTAPTMRGVAEAIVEL